jgi:hypothetical protein
MHRSRSRLPLWLKLVVTAFVAVLVPVYWSQFGPSNFLWFSDLALFALVLALWLEHPLPASMAVVAVLPLEVGWNIDFAALVITGDSLIGLTEYMHDPRIPRGVRAISLFHTPLPILLLWTLYRLGYDRRALWAATLTALAVLPLTYALTDPRDNINWVLGPGGAQTLMHPLLYLALLMVGLPVVVYLPMHLLLRRLFRDARLG